LIVTIEQIEKEMRTAMQPEKVVAAGNESGNQEAWMLFVVSCLPDLQENYSNYDCLLAERRNDRGCGIAGR
jgi:hypothetical protein